MVFTASVTSSTLNELFTSAGSTSPGTLGLLLTVTRDASDRPKADPSSLDAPTQPLCPSRAYSPTVRVCASSSALRRAPGSS